MTHLRCFVICLWALVALSVGGNAVAQNGSGNARFLGVPITSACLISYKLCEGYGPDGHDLLCFTSTAESGGHFFALDLKTDHLAVRPLNTLEAYPILAGSDRNVYVGTTSGEVMRYRPQNGEWTPLGQVFAHTGTVHHVRAMDEADGWIYCGSCYGERARVNTKTGKVEALPPFSEPGSWYVSGVNALPDGRIAFGVGQPIRLFIYDPKLGRDVGQWAPRSWMADGFWHCPIMGRRVLFATDFPSGRRGAWDTTTGRFLGEAPWPAATVDPKWSKWWHSSGFGNTRDYYLIPGTDTIIATNGKRVYQWDPLKPDLPPTLELKDLKLPDSLVKDMRFGFTEDIHLLDYDEHRLNVIEERPIPGPKVARGLHGIAVGPDGCIYGGAYQSLHLFRYDPKADQLADLGNHHPGWGGESYTYSIRGSELISVSYTNGAVVAYDVNKPWDCGAKGMVNPRLIGYLGNFVYRPLASCVDDRGRIWGVGAGGWGTGGAGIGWIDDRTGKHGSVQLGEAPWAVAPVDGNRLIVASPSRLWWWDADANRSIADCAYPAGGADDVIVLNRGATPRIAYFSAGAVRVATLPQPGVIRPERDYPSPVSCNKMALVRGKILVAGQGMALLELADGTWEHFSDLSVGSRWAFAATDDAVYFARGVELWTCPVPK